MGDYKVATHTMGHFASACFLFVIFLPLLDRMESTRSGGAGFALGSSPGVKKHTILPSWVCGSDIESPVISSLTSP